MALKESLPPSVSICEKTYRCAWVTKDPLYIKYHDNEWGVPEYDSIKLFEMLCLEGQQAGLSWLTILKKREKYRELFFNFNPFKIKGLTIDFVDKILEDKECGIVKHRGKINSIISNAESYIKMFECDEDFSKFIWSFVNNKPIINIRKSHTEIPTLTTESSLLSKELKKRGFKFVGPTICYAFMQACGLVNDHVENCLSKA